jgi:hypothetical protein
MSFPLSKPDDFRKPPYLLATRGVLDSELRNHLRMMTGLVQPGDILALCTDALSLYIVENTRRAEELMPQLLFGDRKESRQAFHQFVERERAEGSLRNDDIALVLVALT